MKKVLIVIFSFFLFPLVTLAVNYDIKNYYIDATILDNGDMDVEELIVLKGNFNGYERDILYKNNDVSNYRNASDITNIEVYGKKIDNVSLNTFNEEFAKFNRVITGNVGESLKYEVNNLYDGYRIRMYYKTSGDKSAFLIKYKVKDIGVYHKDCVEFYWNFFGNQFEDKINDIKIRVNLPKNINKDEFHWWFHGDILGNSKLINDNTILGELNELESFSPVDFRLLLPNSYFIKDKFLKITDEEVIDNIIKEEDEIVRKDLETIKFNKIIYYTYLFLSIGFYVVLIVTWYIVYIKYDKERKAQFNLKYNREFIDDYNVEIIDYLMNKTITPNAMSASIMNLIYKKNISFEKIEGSKDDYLFKLLNKDNINETENILIDFLFTTVGNNDTFSTKDLKKYASGTNTCDTFMSSYTRWKNSVINDGKNQGFYDKLGSRFGFGLVILLLALFINITGTVIFNVRMFLIHTLIFASIIFIFYLATITRRSKKGVEHYAKWNAFKNFLNDFGTFEVKELPEIVLWERYLVYATIFGLADRVEKSMNVKIREIELLNDASYNINSFMYINHNIRLAHIINSSINNSYNSAVSTINRNNANASGGSFGGHGGGFSSGGGFGGGGGGGRGF